MDRDTAQQDDTPDRPVPAGPNRRSAAGAGIGLAAPPTLLGTPLGLTSTARAAGGPRPTDPGAYIATGRRPGSFPLVAAGSAAPLVVSADNVGLTVATHRTDRPGRHVLAFWTVDPTVVPQKPVADTGGLQPSYPGPPESHRTDSSRDGQR
jgi:hypothetical protein